nr:MAG TPA: hypothetical protein [Caudoviricetes sp.]
MWIVTNDLPIVPPHYNCRIKPLNITPELF